jgi:hypothetical protein
MRGKVTGPALEGGTMTEIRDRKGPSRFAARQRAMRADLVRGQAPAMILATQWQQYLDRIRRLVRRSAQS